MGKFERTKGLTITFDEKKRTVDIKDFPVEEWSNVITAAFLYNTLSARELKVERQINPQYSTAENIEWVEVRRRRLTEIDNKFKIAVGQTPLNLGDAEDAALEEWVNSQLEYIKLAGDVPEISPAPSRPYLHVFRARLKMLALMQYVAYASHTIIGLSRKNHYNQPSFAIQQLKLVPRLIREIVKHLQRFEAEYDGKYVDVKEQPIERAFD